MCLYCDVDYNVIGKLEDFDEDVAYIAEKQNITEHLGLLKYVQHKTWEKRKDAQSKREKRDKYMSQLSQEMVSDLFELYKIDFEMFGYE